MAYMNPAKKQIIKANLDKVFKPLGIKYSLSVQNNMKITCTVKKAPIDFVGNFNAVMAKDPVNDFLPEALKPRDYVQVNPYWFGDHFTGECKEIIAKAMEALRSADYYDKSDSMIDYFDTAYYYDLQFGRWDTPFQYIKGE